MSDLTNREGAALAAVDDALRTYPLAPVPPDFSLAVMARVRALAPALRFRLAWIDYAISLFAAGMAGLTIILWQSISPQAAAQARMEVMLLWHGFSPVFSVWPALLGGVILTAAALLAATVVFARTPPHLRP